MLVKEQAKAVMQHTTSLLKQGKDTDTTGKEIDIEKVVDKRRAHPFYAYTKRTGEKFHKNFNQK
jgi:hypothetical protein